MEKFISIPVTGSANQLISSNHVIAVVSVTATPTLTTITYLSGKVVTITTATQTNFSVRDAIQNAVAASAAITWSEPVYVISSLPVACSSITVA
jgi:hypothetical protein